MTLSQDPSFAFGRLGLLRLLTLRSVVAVLCALIVPLAITSSIFFTSPVSFQSEMQLIAAANVLMSADVLEDRQHLRDVEESVRRMAAYTQLQELTAISMELASYAFDEHIAMSRQSEEILEKFAEKQISFKDGEGEGQKIVAWDR